MLVSPVPALAFLLPAGRLQISWVAAAGKVGPLPVVSSLAPLPVSREEALDGLRRRGEDGPTPARTRTLLVRGRVRVGVRIGVGVGVGVGGLGLSFRLRVGIRVRVMGGGLGLGLGLTLGASRPKLSAVSTKPSFVTHHSNLTGIMKLRIYIYRRARYEG